MEEKEMLEEIYDNIYKMLESFNEQEKSVLSLIKDNPATIEQCLDSLINVSNEKIKVIENLKDNLS